MKRLAIAGCLGAGVMLFAGCAIPAQVTSPQPTVVITQPPSPTPSETLPSDADIAASVMEQNWSEMDVSDRAALCRFWRSTPTRAWEAFASGDTDGNISKSQFNEFFGRKCQS